MASITEFAWQITRAIIQVAGLIQLNFAQNWSFDMFWNYTKAIKSWGSVKPDVIRLSRMCFFGQPGTMTPRSQRLEQTELEISSAFCLLLPIVYGILFKKMDLSE